MKVLKKYTYSLFMGGAFALAGWDFMSWQFYTAIIPIILLVEWKVAR